MSTFSLATDRVLTAEVDGKVWVRLGSMVAHRGDLTSAGSASEAGGSAVR